MATHVYIDRIGEHVGETVTVKGWLANRRSSGKIHFLVVRDGTGFLQVVMGRSDVGDDTFSSADHLGQESAIIVTGQVRTDQRAKGGYELVASGMQVVAPSHDFPITPKEHGVDYLMDRRHLWIRSERQTAILRVRHEVIDAIRNFFNAEGFTLADTPIFTPAACEGTTTLFPVQYFEDHLAYLTQSGQLYNEANAMALGKVYCFGPTFRAEKSKTRRHLIEFWMLEPEMAFFSLEDLMDTEEQMITAVVQRVLELHRPELELLERDVTKLESIVSPFPRISYDDAIERLKTLREQTDDPEQKELLKIEWGEDFGSPHETALTGLFDRPVFVYHYPSAVKAFYMQPVEGRPEVCRSVDLLAPEGYGEITGGSERIWDAELIDQRVSTIGISRDAYAWYLDLRRFGSVPHAGFGLGLERTVAWICGLQHVRETIPYARMLNRKYP